MASYPSAGRPAQSLPQAGAAKPPVKQEPGGAAAGGAAGAAGPAGGAGGSGSASASAKKAVPPASCSGCGTAGGDLSQSECGHMSLCNACGRSMAEKQATCQQCGAVVDKLVKEFLVRVKPVSRDYFIGKFPQGLPGLKKGDERGWTMKREGVPTGKVLSEAARAKARTRPLLLEDDTGQASYVGHMEGGWQHSAYYLLVMHGKEFVAIPASQWYAFGMQAQYKTLTLEKVELCMQFQTLHFHTIPILPPPRYAFGKQAQYKTLTLEEAELCMQSKRRKADGFRKWLTKEESEKLLAGGGKEGGGGGRGGGRKKGGLDDGLGSDDEGMGGDMEDGEGRKRGQGKKGGDEDDDEVPKEEFELEMDGDKGEDWEHDELFSDDDEATAMQPEDKEDEKEQERSPVKEEEVEEEEEEEGEGQEEGEGISLSHSGKALKKLLHKAGVEGEEGVGARGIGGAGEEEDGEDDEEDLDIAFSPIFQKGKGAGAAAGGQGAGGGKGEGGAAAASVAAGAAAALSAAAAAAAAAAGRGLKRKDLEKGATGGGASGAGAAGAKNWKVEPGKRTPPLPAKREPGAGGAAAGRPGGGASGGGASGAAAGPKPTAVTEEAVKGILRQAPIKSADLVNRFRSCLKTAEVSRVTHGVLTDGFRDQSGL
ncbi:unnamed protein product [Closterium sp. Naga37s-1]|nr:unnamed protein product [Closterium sp. Naga37s-1]